MDKIPEGKKKLSKNSYRNQVVSKLKGISRAILDMSIPFAVDVANCNHIVIFYSS